MQPHDAGFIINFKNKYRKLLLHLVMRYIDDGQTASQIAEEVHVLEEITRPQTVYKSMAPETIRTWFKNVSVCSYYVTHALQIESTLYRCLNVKELLTRGRREIWSLNDCNWTRTHHLVYKRTLNHLAKLAKWLVCVLKTYLYGAFD